MSENLVRHLVSLAGTLVVLLGFVAGYVSAGHGWWWTVFLLILIYAAIFKLVNVAHH